MVRRLALENASYYSSYERLRSVGVLMLEFIIGSSDVFKIDRRTRAILEQRLADESEDIRSFIYQILVLVTANHAWFTHTGGNEGLH